MNSFGTDDKTELKLRLGGYLQPPEQLHRNVLLEQLSASIPKDAQVSVLIYNAEIAPGGYTNWHCHNGATFFVALQGIFEARFDDGSVLTAKAGDCIRSRLAGSIAGTTRTRICPTCASLSASRHPTFRT